jgi:hypothetical protein
MERSQFRSRLLASRCATGILAVLLAFALPGFAQHGPLEVSVGEHGISPAVRDLPTNTELTGHRIKPLRTIPPSRAKSGQIDGALQTSFTAAVATTAALNFAGVGNGDYGFTPNAAPPDTNGAVGATQYVQWVNESFAVFSKSTGSLIKGPIAGNQLFQALGASHPCAINNDGDPIAQYDKQGGRWVLTQFSVTNGPPFYQCVAVSTTSDATGTFHVYAFQQPNFNDYPKLAVWPDAYYATFNIFSGNTFAGARACAFDRNAMLAGTAATQVCFQLSSSFASLLPSDLDGASGAAGTTASPPAGSPNFLLNFGTNSLNLWTFHVDFTTPANSTLTGPTNIPVASFSAACGGGSCVPQPSTRQQLDSLGDRLMYRLAYRNFGGTHESLVVNHSVRVGTARRNPFTGVRWYELRRTPSGSGSFSIFQQGTFSPDSTFRWMGSIAMDKAGDIAVGYSASSSSVFPSLRYTGRVPTDAAGTMEAENILKAGAGSQLSNLNRWGDYSSISVDPGDDCTFFYTNEYLKNNGTFNWSTQIGSFKFPGCQ